MKVERKGREKKIAEYNKKYWQKNKERDSARHKEWYIENKERQQEYNKKYRKENLEELLEKDRIRCRERREDPKHRKWYNEYRKEYDKKKRKTDINFKLKQNISRRIRELLKDGKGHTSMEYCGCTVNELREHLEAKFTEEMDWNNYGNIWHIDHVIPCTAWDMSIDFEAKCCFNYRNLQPMLAKKNILKNNKYRKKDKRKYEALMKTIL